MSEKVEKEKQRRYFELHKHKKNSMERLDLIKQSFSLECVMQNQKNPSIKYTNNKDPVIQGRTQAQSKILNQYRYYYYFHN